MPLVTRKKYSRRQYEQHMMSKTPYELARAKKYSRRPISSRYPTGRNSKKNPIADGYRYYSSKCTIRTAVKLYNEETFPSATPDQTMVGFSRFAYGNTSTG